MSRYQPNQSHSRRDDDNHNYNNSRSSGNYHDNNSGRYGGSSGSGRQSSYNGSGNSYSGSGSGNSYSGHNRRQYDSSRSRSRGEPPPPGEGLPQQYQNQGQFPFLPPIIPLMPFQMPPMQNHHMYFNFNQGDQSHGNYDQRRAYEQERNFRQQQSQGRYDNRDRNFQGRSDDDGGQQEIEFRIDTAAASEPTASNLQRAYGNRQPPSYSRLYYRDNVLGASEHYVSNVQFGCKLAVKEDGTSTPTEVKKSPKPGLRPQIKTIEFFSMSKINNERQDDFDHEDEDRLSRKEAHKSIQDKVEYYNVELRNQPGNESLWKEFVQFQEHVFEESELNFEEGAHEPRKSKKKGRKKAMLEKQVAILDKALGLNPKNLELHILRLNIMFEIYKPNFVLTEWKKLVATTHAQIAPFWMEYLVFACSDLQIYSASAVTQSFERAFEKFRAMLTPDFPVLQKPEKFPLFLADLLFSLALVLKAAGHTEAALSLEQAQLETNFHFPVEAVTKPNNKDDWKNILTLFEQFWNLDSRRFGEAGALGWCNSINDLEDESPDVSSDLSTAIKDSEIVEFEDLFVESLTDSETGQLQQHPISSHWLFMESLRCKVHWLPWRQGVSDVDECDDSQRMVPFKHISPFLTKPPPTIYQSDFEKYSSYFRHVVNYLVLLREDFLPKTYTLDSILPTFTSISLSESRTLLNEIYFWKKYLSLYHDEDYSSNKVPEGFQLSEFTSPGFYLSTGQGSLEVTKPPIVIVIPEYMESVELKKSKLLKENQAKYLNMARSVVEQSIGHLDSSLAIVLVQMLFRFEQKNTFASLESHKSRMKFARNIMKHEKLRSSCGTYGEVALIEYFGGKTDSAISLLVKTINSSRQMLNNKEELNLESDWELMTDLCRLYRTLAELHLKQNSQISLNILLALGNNFDSVSVTVPEGENQPMNKNSFLKAKRQFENVLKWSIPFVFDSNDSSGYLNACDIANKLDGDKCIEYMLQKPNFIVEWTITYALFQYLSTDADFESASEIYNAVLGKVKTESCLSRASKYKSEEVSISHMREQLYLGWCKLGALAVSRDPMLNSKFRTVLGNALQENPSSPPFLVLFSQVERQCSVAGRLWRAMLNLVKQESTQTIVSLHWTPLFMSLNLAMKIEELAHDAEMSLEPFGLGGPAVPPDTIFYKLDAILSAAETNNLTKHCPLIWRVHMKHLAVRVKEGKDHARARALFYDAIRHCPSCKSIYLDAIAYFPDMKQEVIDLMIEKQILVRLPDEEFKLLLEIDSELKNELETTNQSKRAADNTNDSDSESERKKVKKIRRCSPDPEQYDDGEIVELSD